MFCWFSLFLKAASYFIRALEKLPTLIDKEQQKIADIQKDLPVLQRSSLVLGTKKQNLPSLKPILPQLTAGYSCLLLLRVVVLRKERR